MIHQYKQCGYNIVLDICSGAVHIVDDIAYDIISLYENKEKNEVIAEISKKYGDVPRDEIIECYDQVTELENSGEDGDVKKYMLWNNMENMRPTSDVLIY